VENSLVKFIPQPGYYFTGDNLMVPGVPTREDDHTVIWACPTAVYLDGSNDGLGNLSTGVGPVVLNTFVPTGAIPQEVIPLFTSTFSTDLRTAIANQISLNANFGLGYNNITATWYLITAANLDVNATFSLANQQSTAGTQSDASWLIQCTTDGINYTTQVRNLDYYFGSVMETRFFFYTKQPIYDSRTGTVVKDFISVLKTNSQPDSNQPLQGDTRLQIIGQPVLSDGLVDDYQVLVGYQDSNADGVPDNPDFFNDIVAPGVNANKKLVFFQQTVDFDNLQRYLLLEPGVVNSDYATLADIELVKLEYVPGQVFYAYQTQAFYQLNISLTGVRTVDSVSGYISAVGRQSLFFQYRHNAPLSARIDPGSTNIIDLYVVTQEYYTAYRQWIQDTTNTVAQPLPPTIDQLTTAYTGLQAYKMISDNMIVNSVDFQPLFGQKADEALRATIKVIPAVGTTASNNQIRNLVVATMNAYFDIANWNFGDTFYFSELAAYIHSQIGTYVSSVVLYRLIRKNLLATCMKYNVLQIKFLSTALP
jgi:hypothetical protein